MSRQRAYLAALDITPWVRRDPAPVQDVAARPKTVEPSQAPAPADVPAPVTSDPVASASTLGLAFGPGTGACLFLGQSQAAAAGPLASDLARTLPDAPVWCWPDERGGGAVPEAACSERLVTNLFVLGPAVASLVFGKSIPDQCGATRVTVLPSLDELAASADARRACWQELRNAGVVRRKGTEAA